MIKKTLYIITLEPIEQRYSKQWYSHWMKGFSQFFNVVYIDGQVLDDKITKGRFLDINKTNHWKASQVIKLSELFIEDKIKDNDIFLFMDGWHFGITALKYMLQLNKIDGKIYTYLHAGSWDRWDFISQAGLGEWAKFDERAWLTACDGHFVATNFHKKLILDYFNDSTFENKIHVVGFPADWYKFISNEGISPLIMYNKKNLVVFPHRIDKEKQPQVFDKLRDDFKNSEFVKTMLVTKTKREYYDLIKNAKVCFSASLQETYGIGAVECIMFNVIPLVPDRLSYSEMYDKEFKYKNLKEAKSKLKYFISNFDNKNLQKKLNANKLKLLRQSTASIHLMSEVMQHG